MPGFKITNGNSGPSPTTEMARSHRWILEIPTVSGSPSICDYAASVTRPSFEFDKMTMHHRQNEIYLPGKYRWGTCDVKFYEKVSGAGNDTTHFLRKWYSEIVANLVTHQLSNFMNAKQTIDIKLLDGTGKSLWVYRLSGAYPGKVVGSDLDYSSNNISTSTATIVFDGCEEFNEIPKDKSGAILV